MPHNTKFDYIPKAGINHGTPVLLKDLAKNDLLAMLEIIEEARCCADEASLRLLLRKVAGLVSAEVAVCGIALSDLSSVAVVNDNYPEEWLAKYLRERLYHHDPIVKYHQNFTTANFWKEAIRLHGDETSLKVFAVANDYGLKHGISSGIFDPASTSLTIFSFASDRDVFHEEHKVIMNALSLHLHAVLIRLKLVPSR